MAQMVKITDFPFLKLNNRLLELVNLVSQKRVADVGCDHGKVLATLFLANKINFGFACDISLPSVKKAEKLLNNLQIQNFAVRVCDGLEKLSKEDVVECVIIAGMGGMEMLHILTAHEAQNWKAKQYILAPQKNAETLRLFLVENGYFIEKDYVIKENNKFYPILLVKKSNKKQNLTKLELKYGKTNLKNCDPDFIDYLTNEKEKLNHKLLTMPDYKKQLIKEQIHNLENLYKKLKEKKKC